MAGKYPSRGGASPRVTHVSLIYPDRVPRRDRPTPAALDAWRGFLTAHTTAVGELDHELIERHALPLAWYDVLVQLHEAGGEATMGELAERLLIAPSNCTRIVERMQGKGLVERHVDATDHRVRRVQLTPVGGS